MSAINFNSNKRISLVQLADIIINDLHLVRNDFVLAFISLSEIRLTDSKPDDLIYLLKMIIGSRGNLIMPVSPDLNNTLNGFSFQSPFIDDSKPFVQVGDLFSSTASTRKYDKSTTPFAIWGAEKEIVEGRTRSDNGPGGNSLLLSLSGLNAKIIGIGTSASGLPLKSSGEFHGLGDDVSRNVEKRGIKFCISDMKLIRTKD